MPQMGESIFEGTITKWLKKPGDVVQQDEPLFEISTDKVDAEIPSPAAGVLSEIKVQAGTTVQINTVVATISGAGAMLPKRLRRLRCSAEPAASRNGWSNGKPPKSDTSDTEAGERVRSSPLVRKIARENNLDLRHVFRAPGRRAGLPRKIFSASWPRATPPSARRSATTNKRGASRPSARASRAGARACCAKPPVAPVAPVVTPRGTNWCL